MEYYTYIRYKINRKEGHGLRIARGLRGFAYCQVFRKRPIFDH